LFVFRFNDYFTIDCIWCVHFDSLIKKDGWPFSIFVVFYFIVEYCLICCSTASQSSQLSRTHVLFNSSTHLYKPRNPSTIKAL
jgi:hypothetical protein